MPPATELDRLVARAQRGDARALEAVCARARPMLVRHARRLIGPSNDVEDTVQDVLMVLCRRIGTYRWEGSFAGWLYALATRRILRAASRSPSLASVALEAAEAAVVTDHEPMTEAEWNVVEQDLHLACTLAVLVGLPVETRRLYLLGEVLAMPDRVGAEVAGLTPPAYRKRLERARRAVAQAARQPHALPGDDRVGRAAQELDALVRLGELHRAHARPGEADGALRALHRVAPTLAA